MNVRDYLRTTIDLVISYKQNDIRDRVNKWIEEVKECSTSEYYYVMENKLNELIEIVNPDDYE